MTNPKYVKLQQHARINEEVVSNMPILEMQRTLSQRFDGVPLVALVLGDGFIITNGNSQVILDVGAERNRVRHSWCGRLCRPCSKARW